ncbi:unnamed protein product [Eruca vesicaria subsp. sativa]|uniref:UBC core domain-containing protein n=1 Tax=Eruca vesicaria subsp. sativa TaxID=29727 RepID=A0ABC8LIM9_ERUVS|nr:unnamed protein product [Eruca vesicaria subsp. sativa]
MLWNAVIFGPDDTPWDGSTFKLSLQFSEDYPNKPPTVRHCCVILIRILLFSESKRECNRRVSEVVEQSWTADYEVGRLSMQNVRNPCDIARKLIL